MAESIVVREVRGGEAGLSAVVPSLHGRADGLLHDLARQTRRPFEVIVVAGVSPNGRARNLGVARARGAMLLFVDDDARLPDAATVARLLEPLEADARATGAAPSPVGAPRLRVGAVGAAKVLPSRASRFERRVAREVPRTCHDPVGRTIVSNPSVLGYGFSAVTTTCCAMPRAVLEAAGGFSNDLPGGVDTELFWRVRRLGYDILLAGGARVEHRAPRDLRALVRKAYARGFAHGAEARLHPERRIGPRLEGRGAALAWVAFRALGLPVQVLMPASPSDPRLRLGCFPLKALWSFAAAVGYARSRSRPCPRSRRRPIASIDLDLAGARAR